MKNKKNHRVSPIEFLGVSVFSFLVAGCGGEDPGPSILSADSVAAPSGLWALQMVDDASIPDSETASLSVEEFSQAKVLSQDCSGSIRAVVVGEKELRLASPSSRACFVDFPKSVEANRSRISKALESGSEFQINSDSTLTLKTQTGKLIFVRRSDH
jgi:hypothetical protein